MTTPALTHVRTLGYRPEIDGLRAIAVLAVVLFHSQIPGFSGGYIGVDVFFVVSGYLITQIILREADAGTFSFARFYERRVRRIIPALYAVLIASCAAALVLLPEHLRQFSQSVPSVVTFLSNLLFWRESGYFRTDTSSMPLLHTWSLAVEEQFYLLFPLCFVVVLRYRQRLAVPAIAVVATISLLACIYATTTHPEAAFYLAPSRAWELMIGALLALGPVPRPQSRVDGDIAAAIGLAMIASAVFWLTKSARFPGILALVPCIGTALILHGTQAAGSVIGRALSVKPLVAVGLASYSLYLWHWPILVFGTYYIIDPKLLPVARGTLVLLSVPVSFLSWRYIEKPFRGVHGILSRKRLFAYAGVASLAIAIVGIAGYAANGLPQRFDALTLQLATDAKGITNPSWGQSVASLRSGHVFTVGKPGGRPTVAIWGDSHAVMYTHAIELAAARKSATAAVFTVQNCAPFVHATGSNVSCSARVAAILAQIDRLSPRTVVIAARWINYYRRPLGYASAWNMLANGERSLSDQQWRQQFAAELEATATRLKRNGSILYVVAPTPDLWLPGADAVAKAHVLGRDAPVTKSRLAFEAEVAPIMAVLEDLERRGVVRVIRPAAVLCPSGECLLSKDGRSLYNDTNHLNVRGSELTSPLFDVAVAAAKN